MPLSPDFTVGISLDRKIITLIDNTAYGTRNLYVVGVGLYKRDYQNVATQIPITHPGFDSRNAVEWFGDYLQDGHYQYHWVAVSQYSAGTYAKYDAVWSTLNIVYRSLKDGNTDPLNVPASWEVIVDPYTLAANKGTPTESLNISSTIYNRVFAENGKAAYATLVSDQCACTDCDEDETLKTLSDFDTLLTGALIADNRQEVIDGEIICRRIESLYL